ncbi:hypothetical protein [Streptomyces pseudovenezuelae]|uniref:Uncharacterized protein YjbJ (UPF0337 family) n=1 Tax=Streptomyces pseudovenezuelae TaxID=67350 RepID=A0ABT6LVJ6_9ACTN|nr:hypothetical protein [Streptomyces pseudovenezuelae]MDH6219829.1 uncharacterized protein YjbJ (UPF0337 family) [Streptomyces pseudovenezuelae]
MPADEVTHGTDVDESRVRTGPRHAAPKKPLFTRFHMPAGKAIAMAAMPTAVIVGMGFTSSLALADGNGSSPSPSSKSLTADEYKDCLAALEDSDDASGSPSPSASESTGTATPSPSETPSSDSGSDSDPGKTPSSDSGSDDKATPTPSPSKSGGSGDSGGDTATPSPSASESSGGLLDTIGDTIGDILTGGGSSDSSTTSTSPSPSASPSESASKDTSSDVSGTVKDTTKKLTDTVDDTVKDTTDKASKAAKDTTDAAKEAADEATSSASPSPSPSSSTDADDCPTATDDESGVDNKVPVADDPWYLNASSLLLKGADYQGVVEVKTANGTKKKVLKYVISSGTDIGDLHQTVNDEQSGKTYHVQASKGSTSTITDGDTTMYTESISGNLFGLIPITFDPDNPPPLNIPLIYFTNVKVVQAAQFGGTLHIPGMHVYTTD